MRYVAILAGIGLILAVTGTAGAVTFVFDAENFFDYKPVSEGFDLDGGMFKVHKTWGGDMYRSWTDDGGQRTMVDNFAAGLGENEGICRFNIWLANQSNAPLWGETLVSSGSYKPSGTAPSGWTVEVVGNPWPPNGDGQWLVEWSTADSSKYIRPGNSAGEFIFEFLPTTAVTLGDYYTIWFGGVNYDAGSEAEPALVFDAFTDGFASQFIDDGYGSGFEATLSLEAVPEPVTMAGLFLGIGCLARYVRRRKV